MSWEEMVRWIGLGAGIALGFDWFVPIILSKIRQAFCKHEFKIEESKLRIKYRDYINEENEENIRHYRNAFCIKCGFYKRWQTTP